jgi:hypothetical protein
MVAIRVLALLAIVAGTAHANPKRVLVWPQGPTDGVLGVDQAVRDAGFEPIAFTLDEQLRALGDAALADENRVLTDVQNALASARAQFLKQDFAGMADTLASAEMAALRVLGQQQHVAVLWELEFQRGLAEHMRNDAAKARLHWAFALALDENRTPKREQYGPNVARAFTEAIDARAGVPPRPVAIRATPKDARAIVDGVPIVDASAPRSLRPGVHVVFATAPGYAASARLIDVDPAKPLEVTLVAAPGSAIDRIGSAWADGTLDPTTESGRRLILDVAAGLGASAVVVVDDASARLLGDVERFERRATAAAAVAAVLGETAVVDKPTNGKSSVLKKWWLWTAVGVVAAAGVGIAIYATSEDTIRIHSPAQ